MTKLSNSDKKFIEQNKHMDAKILAKEIAKPIALVKEELESTPKEAKEPNMLINPDNGISGIKTKNGKPVCRVMTPGHSEITDEKRQKKDNPNIIHKPLG